MTIEQLEALEKAKDDPTCSFEEFGERSARYAYAQQAAFPHLLAVAKAAHTYCVLSHAGADTHDAYLELWEALDRLEAQ